MITLDEYIHQHGQWHVEELTDQIQANAEVLLSHVNALLQDFGEDRGMRSGWRPQSVNDATPNAARASKHITGQAIDIEDDDGKLKEFVMRRTPDGEYPVLKRYGLYTEYGEATPTWCHLQCVPPGSGKRVYYPNTTWAARAISQGRTV